MLYFRVPKHFENLLLFINSQNQLIWAQANIVSYIRSTYVHNQLPLIFYLELLDDKPNDLNVQIIIQILSSTAKHAKVPFRHIHARGRAWV